MDIAFSILPLLLLSATNKASPLPGETTEADIVPVLLIFPWAWAKSLTWDLVILMFPNVAEILPSVSEIEVIVWPEVPEIAATSKASMSGQKYQK